MPTLIADKNSLRRNADLKMEHFGRDHHPEFLLARLQKLQRSEGDFEARFFVDRGVGKCPNSPAVAGRLTRLV
jgi:hypothetical protein